MSDLQQNDILARERSYWEAHGEYKWMHDDSIEEVLKHLPPLKGDVLELCSGSGMFTRQIPASYASYTCLDLSDNLLKGLKKVLPQIHTVQGDAQNPPFPENSFDALLIFAGLHHLPDLDNTLKNAYRLLKPGGMFFCFEPNNDCWYRKPMLMMRDFINLYTEDERFLSPIYIEQLMKKSGFEEIEATYLTPDYDREHLKKPIQKILGQTLKVAASLSSRPNFQSFFILTGKK